MQCNGTVSLDDFMEHFRGDSQPTYLTVFCCGCSTATITVAEVSHYWNVPQVSTMVGFHQIGICKGLTKIRLSFQTIPQRVKKLGYTGGVCARIHHIHTQKCECTGISSEQYAHDRDHGTVIIP